jgi:hypothetical protein
MTNMIKTGKVKFFNTLGELVEYDFSLSIEELMNFLNSSMISIQELIFFV